MPLRVVIDEAKFRELVAGKIVTHWTGSHHVDIALGDITWQRMVDAIISAVIAPHIPPDPPQAREFLPARKKQGKNK